MRTLNRVGALSAVAAAALLSAPAAAHATAPGDNGTVKIHDASTGEELRKNEPHVCEFYLDAFGFDSVQQVSWHIEAWAPTAAVKGETVKSGAITLDGEGHGRTADMTLPGSATSPATNSIPLSTSSGMKSRLPQSDREL